MMHNISGDMRNYKTYVAWSYQVNNISVIFVRQQSAFNVK